MADVDVDADVEPFGEEPLELTSPDPPLTSFLEKSNRLNSRPDPIMEL